MARRNYELPWEATLWVYVVVLIPMLLLLWKRGWSEPFVDGEAFLFAVPLLVLVFWDLVTSVKRNWAYWSSFERGIMSLALLLNTLLGILTGAILIRGTAGVASGTLKAIFFLAVSGAVVLHELVVSERPLGSFISSSLEAFLTFIRQLRQQIPSIPGDHREQSSPRKFLGSNLRHYAQPFRMAQSADGLLRAIVEADSRLEGASHEKEARRASKDLKDSIAAAKRYLSSSVIP